MNQSKQMTARANCKLADRPTKTEKSGGPILNDDLPPDDYAGFLASALRSMKSSLGERGVLYMFYADAWI